MDRRTLLKAPIALGAGALLGSQLAGCGATEEITSTPASPSSGTSASPDSRVVLAYFSRAGENYYNGDRTMLEVGNTEVVAGLISSAIRVDTYRIEAADPYPESYDATVQRNVREQNSEARPAIASSLPDVSAYDAVLLGSGIWNVRPPMIMRTFVENVDLSGKTIYPFVTYAVSGLGNTVADYTRLCPRSTIGSALAIRGEEARNAGAEVATWLRSIRLLSR